MLLLAGYFSITGKKEVKVENIKGEEDSSLKSPQSSITATLEVNDKKYEGRISQNENIYNLMEEIQNNKKNNFSFQSKEYPGMGQFIESINGVKNNRDQNWIYYVNGKKAEIGVSNYKVNNGDIISWKYEK